MTPSITTSKDLIAIPLDLFKVILLEKKVAFIPN